MWPHSLVKIKSSSKDTKQREVFPIYLLPNGHDIWVCPVTLVREQLC